jgi:hypothetical protein
LDAQPAVLQVRHTSHCVLCMQTYKLHEPWQQVLLFKYGIESSG